MTNVGISYGDEDLRTVKDYKNEQRRGAMRNAYMSAILATVRDMTSAESAKESVAGAGNSNAEGASSASKAIDESETSGEARLDSAHDDDDAEVSAGYEDSASSKSG